jgi:2-C-methyl-D-erythritol 4-phosphate cytidylyltransferase
VLAHPAVTALVVAVPRGEADVAEAMFRSFGVGDRIELRVVEGGATRQASVQAALVATPAQTDVVLVHDAARPFLPAGRLAAVLEEAARYGAAALAIPVADTLRGARDGELARTVDRAGLWAMQTPQAARTALLRDALASATRDGFEGTDEVALLERADIGVRLVEGDARNFKVTTDGDWVMAEALATVMSEER